MARTADYDYEHVHEHDRPSGAQGTGRGIWSSRHLPLGRAETTKGWFGYWFGSRGRLPHTRFLYSVRDGNFRGSGHGTDAGSILVVTLWIVALLGLMALGVTESVRLATRQQAWADGEAQGRALLHSLAQSAIARLKADANGEYDAYSEPWGQAFALSSDSLRTEFQGAGALLPDFEARVIVVDESGKINVNLAPEEVLAEVLRESGYPAEAERIAEAIVDWRDEDSIGAAESDLYAGGDPAYEAANDDLAAIEELLFVAGVAPLAFFGEDANRNGVLDREENDDDLFIPLDNGDGRLQPGLLDLLTVYGDGSINVNTATETVLRVVLGVFLDPQLAESKAREIVAARRGRDGLDGTEDDRPIIDQQGLTAALTEPVMAQAAAAGVVFSLRSMAQRFHVIVTLPKTHQSLEGELLVARDGDELVPLEWREE
mgnify:CR=1 FL=1